MTGPRSTSEWSIELLRGVAALLVVLAHYHALAGVDPGLLRFAFTGVDLFFVISGFVFAPYLFGRPIHVGAHLTRRFFRLYPLYAVALLCYAVLHWMAGRPVEHLLEHALFLHTLESREIAFHFNPAFWSLPPEVEFYLALPLLAWVTGSFRSVLAATGLAVLMHLVLSWASPLTIEAPMNAAALANVHLPGLLSEFLLGTLAWHAARMPLAHAGRVLLVLLALLAWLVLAAVFTSLGDAGIGANDWLRGNLGLLAAAAFAALLVGVIGWVPRPPAWLAATAVAMGNLSYGVYLFHNAMPIVLERWRPLVSGPGFALLCLGATLIVAQLLHWAWEAPCRRLGRRIALRLSALPAS